MKTGLFESRVGQGAATHTRTLFIYTKSARIGPLPGSGRVLTAMRRYDGLLTIMAIASQSPLHPSVAIAIEFLLSLRMLSLDEGTPVLLVHDGPRVPRDDAAFPPPYIQYLGRLQERLPEAVACTKLNVRLVLRATNGFMARNIAFGLQLVQTPYFLKAEMDHVFVRPFDLPGVVRDMSVDQRLKYVRFNRRANFKRGCDTGIYLVGENEKGKAAGGTLFGAHAPPEGVLLRHEYTRTPCFSDMNHVVSTAFFRAHFLPIMLAAPELTPETAIHEGAHTASNHSFYGTFIFGGLGAPATLAHLDGSMHGFGEILPGVRLWLRQLYNGVRNGSLLARGAEPFECRDPLFLEPARASRARADGMAQGSLNRHGLTRRYGQTRKQTRATRTRNITK